MSNAFAKIVRTIAGTTSRPKALTICPSCMRHVVPEHTVNGERCHYCGTTWQPRRSGQLRLVRGRDAQR